MAPETQSHKELKPFVMSQNLILVFTDNLKTRGLEGEGMRNRC